MPEWVRWVKQVKMRSLILAKDAEKAFAGLSEREKAGVAYDLGVIMLILDRVKGAIHPTS